MPGQLVEAAGFGGAGLRPLLFFFGGILLLLLFLKIEVLFTDTSTLIALFINEIFTQSF